MEFDEGRRFVVLSAVEATCSVHISSMVSEVRSVTVPVGEILVVALMPRPDSQLVGMRPHRYEALEAEFVDSEIRSRDGYTGYALLLRRASVEKSCRPLTPGD